MAPKFAILPQLHQDSNIQLKINPTTFQIQTHIQQKINNPDAANDSEQEANNARAAPISTHLDDPPGQIRIGGSSRHGECAKRNVYATQRSASPPREGEVQRLEKKIAKVGRTETQAMKGERERGSGKRLRQSRGTRCRAWQGPAETQSEQASVRTSKRARRRGRGLQLGL